MSKEYRDSSYSTDELLKHEPKYYSKEEYRKAVYDYADREEDRYRRENKDYDGDTGQNPYKS